MAKPTEDVPVVAPRNDPKALEPYAQSKSLQLAGQDPDFEYQWFRKDQLTVKLRQHEVGDKHTGFLMVDPWEVVHYSAELSQGRPRDDAGKPVDTTVTNGELVLCRTPKTNYAKYAVIEKKRDDLIDARLSKGVREPLGDGSTFKTRTVGGRDGLGANANNILAGV